MYKKILFLLCILIVFQTDIHSSEFYLNPHTNRSPFSVDIHLWNTRGPTTYDYPPGSGNTQRIPYDDGINDGMTNSKILKLIPEMGCYWIKDYGQSDGHLYYWPEDPQCGYSYMDSYVQTLNYYKVNSMDVVIGFSSADPLRGKAPDDWTKFFNLQKEIANRYKGTIRFYIAGHEIDNIQGNCRWIDTLKNYVKYLKYTHDAIKSVDSNIFVMMGDLAQAVGGSDSPWNNGEFMHGGGVLSYVDERTLEKVLYEIKTNGNNPVYDTTALGGFPASTDPRDYLDGVAFNAYQFGSVSTSLYDSFINYVYGTLAIYGLEKEIDIYICETGPIYSATREAQADGIITEYLYLLRTGKLSRVSYFHFDGICSSPGNCSQEVGNPFNIIDYDPNHDCVFDISEEIYKYPVWYAHKKMTHLVYPRLEQFDNDEFIEPESAGSKFYLSGWQINNFSTWTITNSTFSGITGNDPNIVFRDLVLPTWRWREQIRTYDWVRYGLNRYFTVKMRQNTSSTATIYWDNISPKGGTDFTSVRSQSFPVIGDGQYHTYTVDLSSNSNWNGIVTSIRFDPTEVSGDNVFIDYLGFYDSQIPQKLSLSVYPTTLPADNKSISWITATIEDELGKPVESSTITVTFNLTGPGSLVGPTVVQIKNGSAGTVYKAGSSPGTTATVSVSATGFSQISAEIMLRTNNTPDSPTNLLCDNQFNPKNLKNFSPVLSWKFNDTDTGDEQFAYRLLVSTDLSVLNSNTGSLWDTNKIISTANSITYAGNNLLPGITYYWKLMTWDMLDEQSPYSSVAEFTMVETMPQQSAIKFDGISANVNLGSSNSLNIHSGNASGLTIEMWVNPGPPTGKVGTLISRYSWDIGGYSLWLWNNYIRVYEFPTGGFECNSYQLEPNRWQHIALQFGTNKRLFINGKEQDVTNTSSAMPGSCASNIFIGGEANSYFNGIIDEVIISSIVRYTSNFLPAVKTYVIDNYVVGLWHFDEGAGTTTADESINRNNGILSGGAQWVEGYIGEIILSVSTTTLDFSEIKIGEIKTLSFEIKNIGVGTLSGSITTDADWILVSPTSFIGNDIQVDVTVDNKILNKGQDRYTGKINIVSNGGNAELNVVFTATCVLTKPNPYNPEQGLLTFFGNGIIPGETKIKIYSLSGELVKQLYSEKGKELVWDGKNESGEPVTNGIYLYTYESPKEKGVGKFTVIYGVNCP